MKYVEVLLVQDVCNSSGNPITFLRELNKWESYHFVGKKIWKTPFGKKITNIALKSEGKKQDLHVHPMKYSMFFWVLIHAIT